MTLSPARTSDRLQVLAAALLFSTGGAAIKACAMGGLQVASLRSGIAAVALLLLVPAARRAWRPGTLAVALAYATTMVLFVLANKLTTAASTIFLQSTAPLYIMLAGPWLLGERLRGRDVGFMLATAAGMALFFVGTPPATGTAPDPLRGNVLAAAAGVSWALTIMGLRWLGRDPSRGDGSPAAVACGNLAAFVVVLPFALPLGPARPLDWALLVFLGVFQIGLAYLFLTGGVRRVGALETSLLLLLEPVLNPFWAFLVHGEVPGAFAVIGGAIILLVATARVWPERPTVRPAAHES